MNRTASLALALGVLAVPVTAVAAGGMVEASLPQKTLVVDAGGRFTLTVGCDNAGPSCAGDLRLYTTSQRPGQARPLASAAAAATRLGVATFLIGAGRHRQVPVRLNAAGRRALARRKGGIYRVNLRVRERQADGTTRGIIDGTIQLRAER